MAQNPLRAYSAHANPVGRRQVLAGLALSHIVTVTPADALITGTTHLEGWKDCLATSREMDAVFWAARAAWQAVDAEWEAAMDRYPNCDAPDSVMDLYGKKQHALLRAAVLAPVSSTKTLLAKLTMLDAGLDIDTGDDDYPDFWACLIRDVERLAK